MRLSPSIKHHIEQPHKSFFYIYILFEQDYSDLAYGTRNIHGQWLCVLEKCILLVRLFHNSLAPLFSWYFFYIHDIDACVFYL